MDEILEIDKPVKHSRRMKNLNGHITGKEIKWVNLATKKSPAHVGFTGKFCHTYEALLSSLHKHFQKIKEEETFPSWFYEASIVMIPKPKTSQENNTTAQYPPWI